MIFCPFSSSFLTGMTLLNLKKKDQRWWGPSNLLFTQEIPFLPSVVDTLLYMCVSCSPLSSKSCVCFSVTQIWFRRKKRDIRFCSLSCSSSSISCCQLTCLYVYYRYLVIYLVFLEIGIPDFTPMAWNSGGIGLQVSSLQPDTQSYKIWVTTQHKDTSSPFFSHLFHTPLPRSYITGSLFLSPLTLLFHCGSMSTS